MFPRISSFLRMGTNLPLEDSLELSVLGVCYILCMCVCVGASDTTTASAVFAIFSRFCYF
jgi:hypothetical protein